MAVAAKSCGYSVGVFKPIQTGAVEKKGRLVSSDLEFVKEVKSVCFNRSDILTFCSYLFREPVAPSLAAALEEVDIDFEKILRDYKELEKKCDFVITEGAGGLLAPVKGKFLMRDMAKLLDLPLVIVARPDLGTINHTLLTIEAARSHNIPIFGIIICDYPVGTENLAVKTAPDIIKEISGEKILGILPKIEDLGNNAAVLKDMVIKNIDLGSIFGSDSVITDKF